MPHAASLDMSTPMTAPFPRSIRALLLDDSNFDRARIRRLSQQTDLAIQLDEVDSIEKMDEAVSKANYDLILIDYRLPVGDGLEALDHVLQNDLNRNAGKIMITGDGARETVIDAMRNGCHDFLTKDEMSVDALRTAMLNALHTAQQRYGAWVQQEQSEVIRKGILAAMQDSEVQKNVVTLFRNGMRLSDRFDQQEAELEALLATFRGEDDFIFH